MKNPYTKTFKKLATIISNSYTNVEYIDDGLFKINDWVLFYGYQMDEKDESKIALNLRNILEKFGAVSLSFECNCAYCNYLRSKV